MLLSIKTMFLAGVLCIGIGAVLGAKLTKPTSQVEIRELLKDRIVTVTREVSKPDGTRITETIKEELKKVEKSTAVSVVEKQDWAVQALYGIAPEPYYGVGIYRRVLGDLYVGGTLNTREEAAVSLLYTF